MYNFNYQDKVFASLPIKGKIWEAHFVHYYFGNKMLLHLEKGAKILDVGCGAGSLTALWQYKFPHFSFYGIEPSQKAVVNAKKLFSHIKVISGKAETLPYKNSFFQGVCCCEVLEHISSPKKALTEIWRVLKPNGLLYLTTPLEKDERTLIGKLYGQRGKLFKDKTAGHIQLFSEDDLKNLFYLTGFKIEKRWYDRMLIGQILDFIYSYFLSKTNHQALDISSNLKKQGGIAWKLGLLGMSLVNTTVNLETLLLRNIPGIGIQYILRKN